MGIDIYMRWKGQTEEERKAQYNTGFSTTAGDVGYLQEAYHGEPYATKSLVPEAFNSKSGEAIIPVKHLLARLPGVLKLAMKREKEIYHGSEDAQMKRAKAFADFVALAERKEKEMGEPVTIYASY
jgi:hypothetical protein